MPLPLLTPSTRTISLPPTIAIRYHGVSSLAPRLPFRTLISTYSPFLLPIVDRVAPMLRIASITF